MALTLKPRNNVEVDPFECLKAGNALFIDGSRIALPASDVDNFFTQILPRLQLGVLILVHDIFALCGYLKNWMCRGDTEQLLLLVLLGLLKHRKRSDFVIL